MSEFGHHSTTDDVLEGHDLAGTTIFITGGNSGLGQETGRAMAAKGAHVVLAGRDQSRLDEAVQAIKAEVEDAQVDTILCDLGSLASVRACGKEARERFDAIDILINNAGIMATPEGRTQDGFESQFGTNHLGHFALTSELMPLIRKGQRKRIINLSSLAHHRSDIDFDDIHFERRDYDPWVSYGQSKTANALFAVGLEKRFGKDGIHAYSVHPGGIMTNLGRHLTEEMRSGLVARMKDRGSGFEWKTIPQGAATSCWAATASGITKDGGAYCEDCGIADIDETSETGGVRPYAIEPESADRLWEMSEAMTGARFPS